MCGIAAAFNVENASYVVSQMLKALQHRGQEASGIASTDGTRLYLIKGPGLTDEVFDTVDFDRSLPGSAAIGHLRYATSGDSGAVESIQPLQAELRGDFPIALVHNGNLTNAEPLRKSMQENGMIFRSHSDTEIFLHLLARSFASEIPFKFKSAFATVEGAYALMAITPRALYAAVDPHGFRPLVMAPYKGGWLLASETCALDLFCAKGEPLSNGQVMELTSEGVHSWTFEVQTQTRHCSFEHIYFSRPDSRVFNKSVYGVRVRLGQLLAQKMREQVGSHKDAIVTAVPDSSNIEALAFAQELGQQFTYAMIRNHYTGRTFITPQQRARELGVRMKLNVVESVVAGRDVYVVDDSLVRGTTGRKVVGLLREAGAREVHMCIASPPVIHPCYWGIDTPEREQLAAANHTLEQIRDMMGVDSLSYLEVSDLLQALEDPQGTSYCTTCFTGERPIRNHSIPPEFLRTA